MSNLRVVYSVPPEPRDPATGLAETLDTMQFGLDLMRDNLRRRHPDLSEAERERLLVAWLHRRPDAPSGDAEGQEREIPARWR
jgi:hypothetical protein